jgi:hypothetical protein
MSGSVWRLSTRWWLISKKEFLPDPKRRNKQSAATATILNLHIPPYNSLSPDSALSSALFCLDRKNDRESGRIVLTALTKQPGADRTGVCFATAQN